MSTALYIEAARQLFKKYRWQIIVSLCGLLCAGLFFIPPVKVRALQGLSYGRSVVAGSPTASPTPNQSEQNRQHIQIIEAELAAAQTELGSLRDVIVETQTQTKEIMADIAHTNDILEKRQLDWLKTLRTIVPTVVMEEIEESIISDEVSKVSVPSVSPPVESGPINLNSATAEQLDSLPGIGPSYAQRIIDYRNQQPFSSVDDLLNIKGIGQALFEKIKELVAV